MTDNFDMDGISLDGISLDDLTSLPDLPVSENEWKHKQSAREDQDSIDISNLDMDSLNMPMAEPVRPRERTSTFGKEPAPAAKEKPAEKAEEAPKAAPAPKPVSSGLPAGYVPPVGGINVQKKSEAAGGAAAAKSEAPAPKPKPAAAAGIELEKKPVNVEKKAVSVPGAAGGIAVQKKSVTTPASSGGYVPPLTPASAPKPVQTNAAPVTTVKKSEIDNISDAIPKKPVAESIEADDISNVSNVKPPVISGMDDIPMPQLSDMNGNETKPKPAPAKTNTAAAPKSSNSYAANRPQSNTSAASAQGLSPSAQRRQEKLNAGFDDQPIRVSQLSHQATVNAQMQEWENQRRKDYEDGRTIVMIISIIYAILGLCNFLGDMSVRQGISLALTAIIALQLFKGNYKVRVWYIVFAILGAIGNIVAIAAVLGLTGVVANLGDDVLAESGITPYVIYIVIVGTLSTVYNIVSSVLLMANKKVRIYFEHT